MVSGGGDAADAAGGGRARGEPRGQAPAAAPGGLPPRPCPQYLPRRRPALHEEWQPPTSLGARQSPRGPLSQSRATAPRRLVVGSHCRQALHTAQPRWPRRLRLPPHPAAAAPPPLATVRPRPYHPKRVTRPWHRCPRRPPGTTPPVRGQACRAGTCPPVRPLPLPPPPPSAGCCRRRHRPRRRRSCTRQVQRPLAAAGGASRCRLEDQPRPWPQPPPALGRVPTRRSTGGEGRAAGGPPAARVLLPLSPPQGTRRAAADNDDDARRRRRRQTPCSDGGRGRPHRGGCGQPRLRRAPNGRGEGVEQKERRGDGQPASGGGGGEERQPGWGRCRAWGGGRGPRWVGRKRGRTWGGGQVRRAEDDARLEATGRHGQHTAPARGGHSNDAVGGATVAS